jgi:hypothetical protein
MDREAWLIDVQAGAHVFRKPLDGEYKDISVVDRPKSCSRCLATVSVDLSLD